MTWLFIDPVCPNAYSLASLDQGGIGGTEATVIRIAERLAEDDKVLVQQHCRAQDAMAMESKAFYVWPGYKPSSKIDKVIVLRCPSAALAARQQYPTSQVYLWCHDLADQRLAWKLPLLHAKGIKVLAVSDFHKGDILDAASTYAKDKPIPEIKVLYNPIEDDLLPDATPVNPNKLVFFSSPHKGLKHTLDIFSSLRNFNPKLELYVANPGYLDGALEATPGVHILGKLPRAEALGHVREAFCVLYLNHVFPETFGLVFAEANAVGTPVLTHSLGAAREVLKYPMQLVDTRDRKKTMDAFLKWQEPGNRPVVAGQEVFRMRNVIKQWRKL